MDVVSRNHGQAVAGEQHGGIAGNDASVSAWCSGVHW